MVSGEDFFSCKKWASNEFSSIFWSPIMKIAFASSFSNAPKIKTKLNGRTTTGMLYINAIEKYGVFRARRIS